ncbi:mercuric reductase [Myxococcota bacterium]|nr:mercuric reductase [Myxococcota bacterium]
MTDAHSEDTSNPHDDQWLRNVRPDDWRNPEPPGRYNLVVIGAGSAGLITASVAAGIGARVALIERNRMGGDCLNTGCVPSKSLIHSTRRLARIRHTTALQMAKGSTEDVDFAGVMGRMREVRARISAEDSATRYRDELGVDVYFGNARFDGPDRVSVGDQSLRFSRAVIATGARPTLPPIPGLSDADPLTSENVFELQELPRRLGIVGAGPIGCELAQVFARLGSEVTLFDVADRILTREDSDAAEIVGRQLQSEGVELVLGCSIDRVQRIGSEKQLHLRRSGKDAGIQTIDHLLVGTGRAPNIADLGLESAGIEYDEQLGIRVDDYLRTTHSRVYAAGDVCMSWQFTHAADAAAKLVVRNALLFPSQKVSSLVMPWCIYTDPEVAQVGLNPLEAARQRIEIDTYHVPLEEVNRAVLDGEDRGFIRIHTKRGKDRILGATIVASHAGEMISEITLAMKSEIGLGKFVDVIHPYPTQADGIRRAAGMYARSRFTPRMAAIARRLLAWRR